MNLDEREKQVENRNKEDKHKAEWHLEKTHNHKSHKPGTIPQMSPANLSRAHADVTTEVSSSLHRECERVREYFCRALRFKPQRETKGRTDGPNSERFVSLCIWTFVRRKAPADAFCVQTLHFSHFIFGSDKDKVHKNIKHLHREIINTTLKQPHRVFLSVFTRP